MRNEFFADARDIQKWSFLVDLAERRRIGRILQVAMLTQDEHKGEGRIYRLRGTCRQDVKRFFEAQRKAKRTVKDVETLGNHLDRRLHIRVFDDRLDPVEREDYFERARRLLIREKIVKQLVFLDPDTGLIPESGRPGSPRGGRWVIKEEILLVFGCLSRDSLLAVYQHNTRRKGWANQAQRTMEQITGKRAEIEKLGQVAFVWVAR